jgi:uncharacterized membrane protein YdbT with pleckstrin-like domain
MRELFIYFRARAPDDALVKEAIHAMQDQLRRAWPGLKTRLLHRPQVHDGLRTWMEVYSTADALGVSLSVQAAIESAAQAMLPWQVGERHVEVFVDGG